MKFYKQYFIKLHSYLFISFIHGKFSNDIYYTFKINNLCAENCNIVIGGTNLHGIMLNNIKADNVNKIIDAEVITNSTINNLNVNNNDKGCFMNKDFNYLINANKSLKNTKIGNIDIETSKEIGVINSDEIENLEINDLRYKIINHEDIEQLKELLLKESNDKIFDINIIEDLENYKQDSSLVTKISSGISKFISSCDNSPTIQTMIQLATKIGLKID